MDYLGPEQVIKAFSKYRELRRLARNFNSYDQFLHFLGTNRDEVLNLFSENEEAKRKVQWLLGPHAQAMYKAWVAQNPDKVDWP